MTNTELKTQIDTNITLKTSAKSISPSDVGNDMKAIVDYIDQEKTKYKSYIAIINSSSVITVLEDSIGFGTPTITNPSNGKINITNTGFFSGKIIDPITQGTINNAGTPYLTVLDKSYVFPNDTLVLDIFNLSGTQTSTPNTQYKVEIRVYS